MYQLVFYVPQSHLEQVKDACFSAGAGRYRHYDSCSFQTPGQGQFRPVEGSQPFLGTTGSLETVDEYRLEMVCEDAVILAVVEALLAAHPYEEPAFSVFPLVTVRELRRRGAEPPPG